MRSRQSFYIIILMNKDVIYIEPDYDITDIVEKIKSAKNKIIALVPPKKAGVLSTAVNFRILQKAALRQEKTIVLITADQNLVKLAYSVKIPVAKTLNSKPQLPTEDAEEFGADDEDNDLTVEEKDPKSDKKEDGDKDSKSDKSGKSKDKKDKDGKSKKSKDDKDDKDSDKKEDAVDMEFKDDSDEASARKKNNKKVPNFKKYRGPIIVVAILVIASIAFGFWAAVIAPAAQIDIKVRTTDNNFTKTVTIVTDEAAADPENGIFFAESKSIEKNASGDFEATGERDEGAKASGDVTVSLSGEVTLKCAPSTEAVFDLDCNGSKTTIPKGTTFTHAGKNYVSTAEATLKAPTKSDIDDRSCRLSGLDRICKVKGGISTKVHVVAEASGESYNTDGSGSWTTNKSGVSVGGGAMSGGTTKIVIFVSEDDVAAAEENLDVASQSDARKELEEELKEEYLIIGDSFEVKDEPIVSSPEINSAVADGVMPKVVKKSTYTVLGVKREVIDDYIRKEVKAKLGDDTQDVYITGAVDVAGDKEKGKKAYPARAFFESYREVDGKHVVKLKSVAKTGPRITNEQVFEIAK